MSELTELKRRQEAAFYENWLSRKGSISPEDTVTTLSPREVMQEMANMSIVDDHGSVTVMDRVVGKMLTLAMEGDKQMLNKVYDELEHLGVQKVEVTHREEQLTPAQWKILEDAGFVDAEFTVEEPEKLIEHDNGQTLNDIAEGTQDVAEEEAVAHLDTTQLDTPQDQDFIDFFEGCED